MKVFIYPWSYFLFWGNLLFWHLSVLRKRYFWICALTTNYRRFKKYYCFEFTLNMETRLTIFQGGGFSPGLSAKYLLLILLLPRKWLPFSFWTATFSFFLNILYCFCVLPACWGWFISPNLWWESNLQFESELKKTSHWARRAKPQQLLSVKHFS